MSAADRADGGPPCWGSVVALRALGLGDLLTAVPALRALRRAAERLVLAAPGGLAPLVELAVDARVLDTGPFLDVAPGGRLGLAEPVDVAVNLHGAGPQSTDLARTAAPRRLVSYGVTSAWRDDEHEVARWCRLVTEAGAPADPGDLALARPDVPSPAPGAVVVHPGAASPARRWPAQHWAGVARVLCAAGRDVVVTGTPAEARLTAAVAEPSGARNLAGRTGLLDLAALVASARLVLSGDTGMAHLATAYGVPSVVLFGPTSPALWGPPPRPQHRVLWSGTTSDPHGAAPPPGLLAIDVAAVLTAARAVDP
jgi:ADP-heptose:LPS heptosyltransferase